MVLTSILIASTTVRLGQAQAPDVKTIIEKSVQANQEDFKQAPSLDYKETDEIGKGSTKTYQVTMIVGTPYERLLATDGETLSKDQAEEEAKKEQQVKTQRERESPKQKHDRIAKWQRERNRDHQMMTELTRAFDFKITGERSVRGFDVWVLAATPRSGYTPPTRNAQVLTGMQGELWIDQKTYQWVKVTAQVIHPVYIEGFLARVDPGTQFELEMSPVEGGSWQTTHFSVKSQARVLEVFHRSSSEDETYFDFKRTNSSMVRTSSSDENHSAVRGSQPPGMGSNRP